MSILFLGNAIGFIGSLFMVLGGLIKNKNKALMAQTAQMTLLSISNLILGSVSGFIMNLISVIRNFLSTKNLLNRTAIIFIIFFSVILTFHFNNLGLIGYLPLINNIIFILFMNTKNPVHFKLLTILYMSLWLVHNLFIQAYTTSIFNVITIITSITTIYRIQKEKKSNRSSLN